MNWMVKSGDVTTYQYRLVGKTMTVTWFLTTTTIAGTPDSTLRIRIPGGFIAARRTRVPYVRLNKTEYAEAVAEVPEGGTTINLYRDLTTNRNWTQEKNLTEVYGQITFEVR